jgi:8-hydroxy-5-deazaflavin:NADPH oxidoreductase
LRDFGKAKGNQDRIALGVSGDDQHSKEVVFQLVDELGFDSSDIGSIHDSWKQQPGSPIYCRDLTLRELNNRVNTLGADWSEMREVILAKRKLDEGLMKAGYQTYLRNLT